MADNDLPQLTSAELALMRVLWSHERMSARELHDRLSEKGWSRSTTRTLLARLVAKEAVGKETFHGLQLYVARIGRPAGLAALVRDFARQVLQADPSAVVPLFATSGSLTDAEVAELEALLTEDGA